MKYLAKYLPTGQLDQVIDAKNKIKIRTDQESYVAGDMVTGSITVTCVVPFTCNGFILRVVGKEFAKFEELKYETVVDSQGNSHTEPKLYKYKDDKKTVDIELRPYTTPGVFPVGEFTYPYQFQLPVDLASCFKASGGKKGQDKYKCKSSYKLIAYADLPFNHNLADKTKLVVNEKFDKMVQPSYAHNSKGFLLASGKLDCQCWLDKNCYFPGDRVMAKMEANNTSTKKTKRIMMDINLKISLKADHHSTSYNIRVHRSEFPGFDPCFYGIRYLPFNAPPELQPSCDGKLIKAEYTMELQCDIPGAIDLALKLPIKLLAPQFLFATTMPHPSYLPPPPDETYRPPWQADASNCELCAKKFGLLSRPHHCRHCHCTVCDKCSKTTMALPNLGYNDPVRICTKCIPAASQGGVRYLQVSGDQGSLALAQTNTVVVGNREGWGFVENNGMVLEVHPEQDNAIFLAPKLVPAQDNQLFRVAGKVIISKATEGVLDVKGGKAKADCPIISWPRHDGYNQQWKHTPNGFQSGLSGVFSGNWVFGPKSGTLVAGDMIVLQKERNSQEQKFIFTRI